MHLQFAGVGFFFFGCNTGVLFQNETRADYYYARMQNLLALEGIEVKCLI
jgi:hypothetical protein